MEQGNAGARKRSILIIDDDDGWRDVFSMGLSMRGYEVGTAASGEEGIEVAKTRSFDAVVCDVQMPGMGGFKAMEILRTQYPGMVIIVLTAHDTPDSLQTARGIGVDDFVIKPCKIADLCQLLNKALLAKGGQPS